MASVWLGGRGGWLLAISSQTLTLPQQKEYLLGLSGSKAHEKGEAIKRGSSDIKKIPCKDLL